MRSKQHLDCRPAVKFEPEIRCKAYEQQWDWAVQYRTEIHLHVEFLEDIFQMYHNVRRSFCWLETDNIILVPLKLLSSDGGRRGDSRKKATAVPPVVVVKPLGCVRRID